MCLNRSSWDAGKGVNLTEIEIIFIYGVSTRMSKKWVSIYFIHPNIWIYVYWHCYSYFSFSVCGYGLLSFEISMLSFHSTTCYCWCASLYLDPRKEEEKRKKISFIHRNPFFLFFGFFAQNTLTYNFCLAFYNLYLSSVSTRHFQRLS